VDDGAGFVTAFLIFAFRGAVRDDAAACLNALKGWVRLALITDGYHATQHAKLRSLGLSLHFDHLRVTDDWGREFWKPHPRAFWEVASLFNVAPWECVYVGDNPHKDFVSPLQLGWQTVRVRRPEGLHAGIDSSHGTVDIEVADLSHLTDLFLGRENVRAA